MSSILAAQAIIEKAIEYCSIPSVVWYEAPFAHHLQKEYEQLGYHTSLINNSLLVHGSDPMQPLISVHIDRHWLIKTGIHEYTYAWFVVERDWFHVDYFKTPDFLNTLSKWYLGQPVIAYDYLTGENIADGVILDANINEATDSLIFSVAGTENVPIWTPLSYSVAYKKTEDMFSAQIDNLIFAAVVYQLCLHGYQGSILFTPEEEIGQSWSYLLYHLEKAQTDIQQILVLDTCPMEGDLPLKAGNIVLRNKDALASFNPDMIASLEKILLQENIPYVKVDEMIENENRLHEQFKQPLKWLWITELWQLISHTQWKYSGATLQIPTNWYHTNHETTSVACIANVYAVLSKYIWLT